MFTKKEIIESISQLSETVGVDKKDMLVCGSGALVMLDLKEIAQDIDIEVSEEVFGYLKERFPENIKVKEYGESHPLYEVGKNLTYLTFGKIEVLLKTFESMEDPDVTEGIYHLSTNDTVRFKLWLGREKDIHHLKEAALID